MNQDILTLDQLQPSQAAHVVGFADNVEQRIIEMGLTEGTLLQIEHIAPFGGSLAVRCRDTLIAMRFETARNIFVRVKLP